MSEENGRAIVDTGLGGGTLFEFILEQDRLQAAAGPPRSYQRVDIQTDKRVVGGLIVRVGVVHDDELTDTYILQIASDTDGAAEVAVAVADGTVAVRVLG